MAKLELNIKKAQEWSVFVKRAAPPFQALGLDKNLLPLHKPPRANKQVSKFFHLGVARLLGAWESLACKIFLATKQQSLWLSLLVAILQLSKKADGPSQATKVFNILGATELHISSEITITMLNWEGIFSLDKETP